MEPKLFIATKALIAYEGKILLLRESGVYQEGTNAGRFDVPGGRLKLGERFDEALRREVFEETGLEIEIGRPIAVNEWRPVVRGEQWQIVGIFYQHIGIDEGQFKQIFFFHTHHGKHFAQFHFCHSQCSGFISKNYTGVS